MSIDLRAASAFITTHARLLDRHRFRLLLGDSGPDGVLAALEAGGPTHPDNAQLRCDYHNRWRWHHPDPPPADPPPGADDDSGPNTGLDWLETWRANLQATILAEPDD